MKRIAFTGSTGQIAYSLAFRIAHGDVFGKEELSFHLVDVPGTERMLEGLVMELEDAAFPLLKEIHYGVDLHRMFKDIDLALLLGAKPREKGMERSDLLIENGKIFTKVGRALNESAKKEVKVVIVGNPCNTNCLIAIHHAPDLDPKNFHAMMRLDQNRAAALLAKKANSSVKEISSMAVWGNHSSTQVPDFVHAKIGGKKAIEVIRDREWFQGEFIETIQKRGAAIIEARGKSSAASAASALIDSLVSLYTQTPKGDWFTTAVHTRNNPYGIDEDLIFGFPCTSKGDGTYSVVENLEWDYFVKEKIAVTQQELISERECVKALLTQNSDY